MKTFLSFATFFLFVSHALSTGTYPLQIGNRWDYGEPSGPNQWAYYYTVRIVDDTLMPNGHTYYVELSNKDGGQHFRYLRQEDSFVFSYANTNESILYDFSRQNGDTIAIIYTSTDTILTTLQIESSLCFGQERQTWIYFTKSYQTSMYSFQYVADNIGFTGYSAEPGWGYTCMGAIIDNVQYGIITSVSIPEQTVPSIFKLFHNYPNPFNPSTTIRLSSDISDNIVLAIFNSVGQQCAVLHRGWIEAGNYTFQWNAKDFPSGVYLCRLEAGKSSKTIKLLLLK